MSPTGCKEPVGFIEHRLNIDRSGPFCTGFLTHSGAMGLQIRHRLLGSIRAVRCHEPARLLGKQLGAFLQFFEPGLVWIAWLAWVDDGDLAILGCLD